METTKIEWADATFNPWMGCTKVSPACKHCYAERDMDHRYGKVAWGPSGTRVKTTEANWRKPLAWNKKAEAAGTRTRVFCSSLADVFEDWSGPIHDHKGKVLLKRDGQIITEGEEDPNDFTCCLTMGDLRERLFRLIDRTPNLDWMLLTKRPENIIRMWPETALKVSDKCWDNHFLGEHLKGHKHHRPNVWLGTSVESQEYADKRIPELLKCRGLASVLFLSCEPLVGPLDLSGFFSDIPDCTFDPGIDWVITGGESGPDARPMHPNWFRSLRDQCDASGVPFHFKQWGEWAPSFLHPLVDEILPWHEQGDYHGMARVGKKVAGRLLDGREHNGLPEPAIQHAR